MKPVSKPEALLRGKDCHEGNLKSLIACLEHERPLIFRTTDDPNLQPGPLHAIDWEKPVNFLQGILRLVCSISGHDESAFNVSPILRYESSRQIAKTGAGIFLAPETVLDDEVLRQIDHKLASFCHAILASQALDVQGEIFPVENPKNDTEIAEVVEDFLDSYGGKSVGESLLLKTKNCKLLIAGTYRTGQVHPLPSPKRWTITGEIDGLRGKSRTLYINTTDKKTINILFDVQRFKEQLLCRVLDGMRYQFEIETELIAHDKAPIDSLISFSPCDTSETFLS